MFALMPEGEIVTYCAVEQEKHAKLSNGTLQT